MTRSMTAALGLTLLLTSLSTNTGGQSPTRTAANFPKIDELVLDNGLRILVVTDRRVPRVSASLWYRLGALQEIQGEHGSTHFLEHAVHQGTTTVGTKDFEAEKPLLREIFETERQLLEAHNRERNRLRQRDVFHGDLQWPSTPEIDALRQKLYALEDQDSRYREFWAEYNWYRRYGAVSTHNDPVPATTGHEQLEIDIDLPREHLELVFRLEADRMVNAVLRGWEAQRFTVLEQILGGRQRAADERGRFQEIINGVTGVSHSIYLRSGGHLRDFAFYSRHSMLRMYDDYFVPNNATLVLVGDVTVVEARALADRYFALVPRGAEPPARMDAEADAVPGGTIRLDWMEPVDNRVLVRHRVPAVGHPQRPAFDTIAALLRGEHGLIASRIRADRIGMAGVQVSGGRAGVPSTFDVLVTARREEDLPGLEASVLKVVADLQAGRIDASALDRARTALHLDRAVSVNDRQRLAGELGRFQVLDSWRTWQPYMEARERATVDDIQRAAARYFVPSNRVIVTARRAPGGTTPVPSQAGTGGAR